MKLYNLNSTILICKHCFVYQVSPGSLDQIDPRNNKKLCSYSYKDIELIALVRSFSFACFIVDDRQYVLFIYLFQRFQTILVDLLLFTAVLVGWYVSRHMSEIGNTAIISILNQA